MIDKVQLFKALGDKSRLMIVYALKTEGEMYVELLSQRLGLSQSTISFHLKKLEECGIVKSIKEQYYVVFSLNKEILENRIIDLIDSENDELVAQKKREKVYRNDVLNTYLHKGRLISIPVQKERKKIVLDYIIKEFRDKEFYTLKEVNDKLIKMTLDVDKLRYELIENSYLCDEEGKFLLTEEEANKLKEITTPKVLLKFILESEEVILYKKDDVKIKVKNINNVVESGLLITDKGRILIHLILKNKALGRLDYIYTYNFRNESYKVGSSIFEKSFSYDLFDNKQIECVKEENKIICRGNNLKIRGENGIGGLPTTADIEFEMNENELSELRNKLKVNLFYLK